MRSLLSAALVPLVILAACRRPDPAPALPPGVMAQLGPGTLTVVLPLADSAGRWLDARDRFHWRISAPAAPTLSYELDDSVVAQGSPAHARLVQGVLSRCEPRGHMLLCGWRLPTRAAMVNGRLLVQVRDPEVVAAWRAADPRIVQRGTWHGSRLVLLDSVPLVVHR